MKLILTISAMILFLITGCESGKQPANDFLTVDITANYPKKELILQDFLDVEYIPLETNEEFITSASMQAIGKNLIILRNKNGQDGDIFIFDRTGKGQRKSTAAAKVAKNTRISGLLPSMRRKVSCLSTTTTRASLSYTTCPETLSEL